MAARPWLVASPSPGASPVFPHSACRLRRQAPRRAPQLCDGVGMAMVESGGRPHRNPPLLDAVRAAPLLPPFWSRAPTTVPLNYRLSVARLSLWTVWAVRVGKGDAEKSEGASIEIS